MQNCRLWQVQVRTAPQGKKVASTSLSALHSGLSKVGSLAKSAGSAVLRGTIEVKEVRLSPNIDVNDLNTKCNSARKFIEKGNKVKVSLRFRGREMAHIDSTKHILEDFAEKLSDIAVIEKAPKMEGRSMMMFLTEKR